MRFSDFLLVSNPTDLDFIVGYTDEQNIRINVLDLFAGQIIGDGTPGYVPVFTAENVIDDSVIFQHGTNIVIGGVDSLGYKLAVSGSLYASNGAVINSTALGADALRVIAVDGDIFVIPNDLGQSISSLRRIAHPPAVLTTESATLGQLNTAISNLEGDIEILLDLKVDKSSVGEPNGVASLDATGKIPLSEIPDSIIGQVEYMGTWNAFTNTPTLNPLIPEQKGHYYVVSAAGVFGGVDYQVGDWIISNGVEWQKVDNTDAVTSVFGRIGAILALEADYQSFYPRLSQAYDNPTWINTLAFSKITDVPPFLLENQTITLSGDVTGSGKTSIASTISNNAVTDSKLRDSVGTSVIGRASSTTGDPADIQASTDGHVLQRSGGTLLFGLISSDSIGSIDWSKIINTPTTLSGYGITNAYTKTESDNKFVPYTGANANVNLGSNNITANSFIKAGGTSAQFLKADGSVDVSQYVPTTRSVNAGTGLTGGGNLSSDITLAFDTTWGDTRYAYRTREIIAGTGLLGGGDLSANRTLSFDTVWGDARYLAPLSGYVPYTGATTNVNLGEFGVRAGYVQLDTTPTSTPTAQGTIYWDQDDNTIDAVLNGYIMKIGEDQFYPVKNQTGSPIAKGTAVRFAGTVGASGRLLIQPFIADGSVPSTYFMGVTAETIANGADGKVLWFGRIRGINTNAYNEGDILYASTTVPGGFQTTVPVAPNNIVQVAAVITKHVNNGTIFIRPTLGSNINKDEGVKITSPVVGQLLQLQSGNIWENKSLGQVIGGLSSQFLKGDGSLDSTSYVPFARQITINGTTFDLSADRTWNVGTVTSVGLSVPVGFAVTNSPITSSGNIVLGFDSGYSLPTNAKQLEWDTAYANRIASLTTTGTSGASTFISNVLNIPQYQAQGNYITNLTGEVTANGPGSVSATISNSAVIGKVLTGLSVTGSAILASDTILQAFGKLQGQVNGLVGGLQYQGTWNANTNTPTLTSGVGTDGHFYIVSVAGNTTIDGLSNWQVGDWIVFHTPSWQKVDNTESVTSVNGQVGAVNLSTTEIPEGTNLYFTNARSRQSISLTTTGSSGAATYNNSTGVFNIPQYSLSGLGGVPTTRSLTINGVTFDLSSDRSWTVGDVRTDVVYTNPGFIGTLAWGKITGTPTTLAGYGITDAYTQTQVNNLLAGYVTLATDQTITGLKTIVRSGDVLSFKIGTDTLYGLKVAYNQNELVPSGEATWSFVNTFNRNGVGYETTPISFFRGVLVIGERLLTSSINSNLLDYYSNNPSGRYPVYAYNTGVQQFSTSILVGYTTGLVNASTGAISQLPSGVVANFNGRVIGQSAANSNEFVTLSQLGSYVQGSGTATQVAFWTSSGVISSSSGFYWDNSSGRLAVGKNDSNARLEVYAGTKGQIRANGGTTMGGGIDIYTELSGTARRNWGIQTEVQTPGDFSILCSNTAGTAPVNEVFTIQNTGVGSYKFALNVVGNLSTSAKLGAADNNGVFYRGVEDVTWKTYYKTASPNGLYTEINGNYFIDAYNSGTPITRFSFTTAGNFTATAVITGQEYVSNAINVADEWYFFRGNSSVSNALTMYTYANIVYVNAYSGYHIRSNNTGGSGGYINLHGSSIMLGTANSPILHSGTRGVVIQGSARGILEIWDASSGKSVFQNVGGTTYIGQLDKGSGTGDLYLLVNGNGSSADVGMLLKANKNVLIGTETQLQFDERLGVSSSINTAILAQFTGGATSGWASKFWNNGTSGNNLIVEFLTESSITARGSIRYDRSGNRLNIVGEGGGLLFTGAATFSSSVTANGAGSATSGTINLISSDSFIRFNTTGGTADKQKWDIRAISATGFEALEFRTVNDANNSFSTKMWLAHNGNVGIGTISPSDFIDASLGLAVISSIGRTGLSLGSTQGTANEVLGRLSFTNTNSTNIGSKRLAYISGIRGTTDNSAYLEFGTADNALGTQRMVISQTGNVGVGTSSPQSPIDVISPTNGYVSFGRNISIGQWTGIHFGYREDNTFYRKSAIVFERTGGAAQGNIHFLNNNANDITSASLSDSRMTITSSGNVGIGTGSPSNKLQIASGNIGLDDSWSINFGSGSTFINGTSASNLLRFITSSTERMQITSDGIVDVKRNMIVGSAINNTQNLNISENQIFRTGAGEFLLNFSGTGNIRAVEGGGSLLVNTGTRWNQERFGIQISNSASWASVPAMMRLTNFVAGGMTKITFTDSSIIDGIFGMIPVSTRSYFVMGFAGSVEQGFKLYQNGFAHVNNRLGVNVDFDALTFRTQIADVGAIISGGEAISTSTMKGLMIENTNNGTESVGLWFRTGGNHLSGISAQRTTDINSWSTDLRFYTHQNATTALTSAFERVRITSEGELLVGTTTSNGARFHVNGSIRTAAPYLSAANNWLLGGFQFGSQTPNGTIRVQIGTRYYNIIAQDLGEVPS